MINRRDRERLLRPTTLVLIIAAVGGLLLLLFPHQQLRDPDLAQRPDELAVAYLRLVLRSQPEDHTVRLLLAKQLFSLGRLSQCLTTLGPLLVAESTSGTRARFLALEVHRAQYNALQPSDKERPALSLAVARDITRLLQDRLAVDEMVRLGELSLELGRPEMAAHIYNQLAAPATHKRSHWYALAGRWYQAGGYLPEAAAAFVKASKTALEAKDQVQLGLSAVSAWRAADRGADALILMRGLIKRFPAHPQLLAEGVSLAVTQGAHAEARNWGRRLMQRQPTIRNVALLQRQLSLELAVRDMAAALELAREIATARPADAAAREQLARVAQWADQPHTALRAWLWLADRGNVEAAEVAEALAIGLAAKEDTAHLLRLKAERQQLTTPQLKQLIATLEGFGEPGRAVAVLRGYLAQYPGHRDGWELLAKIERRRGNPQAALAVWRQIDARFQLTVRQVVHVARLLWELHQPKQALTQLRKAMSRANPTDAVFWGLLGELAWQLEESQLALAAYRTIWRFQRHKVFEAERLIVLALEVERLVVLTLEDKRPLDEVIQLSQQAWDRFKQPSLLLLVMERVADLGSWERLRALLQVVEKQQRRFVGYALFWRLRAELALADKDFEAAKENYSRALALEPMSSAARLGWLWASFSLGQQRSVYDALRRWWAIALADPAFWPVYAVLLDRLGRPREALQWYERRARAQPKNLNLVMDYADALERNRMTTRAWRLKHYLWGKLQPQALKALRGFSTLDGRWALRRYSRLANQRALDAPRYLPLRASRDVLLNYGQLVGQVGSPDAAQAWLTPLLAHGTGDPKVQEFATAWYLDKNMPSQARVWLQRQAANGRRPKASNRLHFALADSDSVRAFQLLREEGRSIAVTERIAALLQLGRRRVAYQLAHASLSSALPQEEAGLRHSLQQLEDERAPRLTLRSGWSKLGPLQNWSQAVDVAFSSDWHHFQPTLTLSTLQPESGSGLTDQAHHRVQLDSAASWRGRALSATLGAGLELGSDIEALPSAFGRTVFRPLEMLRFQLRGGINQASRDSAALRLAGRVSQIQAETSASLRWSGLTTLRGGVGWRHFSDHALTRLGDGMTTDVNLEHSWGIVGHTAMQLATGAVWARNQLANVLPAGFTKLLGPAATPATVLPATFSSVGVGLTLRQGELGRATLLGPPLRYRVGGWLGWLWPDKRLDYRFELAVAWLIYSRHEIGLNAEYGGQQEAIFGQQNLSFSLNYTYRMGP